LRRKVEIMYPQIHTKRNGSNSSLKNLKRKTTGYLRKPIALSIILVYIFFDKARFPMPSSLHKINIYVLLLLMFSILEQPFCKPH